MNEEDITRWCGGKVFPGAQLEAVLDTGSAIDGGCSGPMPGYILKDVFLKIYFTVELPKYIYT